MCGKYNFNVKICIQIYLGWFFFGEYKYIWNQLFRQLQIYSGEQKSANLNINTNIWTVIHKNEYKYLSQTKPKINVPLDIKAIQVFKKNYAYMCHSMRFIQIRIQIWTYLGWYKKGKYKYE